MMNTQLSNIKKKQIIFDLNEHTRSLSYAAREKVIKRSVKAKDKRISLGGILGVGCSSGGINEDFEHTSV